MFEVPFAKRFHELLEGLAKLPEEMFSELINCEIKLPPLDESWTDLKAWMREMRKRADGQRSGGEE
jgi:hypothetical protein